MKLKVSSQFSGIHHFGPAQAKLKLENWRFSKGRRFSGFCSEGSASPLHLRSSYWRKVSSSSAIKANTHTSLSSVARYHDLPPLLYISYFLTTTHHTPVQKATITSSIYLLLGPQPGVSSSSQNPDQHQYHHQLHNQTQYQNQDKRRKCKHIHNVHLRNNLFRLSDRQD